MGLSGLILAVSYPTLSKQPLWGRMVYLNLKSTLNMFCVEAVEKQTKIN